MVHTAIQIGPLILEWNDSSILLPCGTKEWSSTSGHTSSKVLVALDLKTLETKDFFTNYIDKICNLVAKWNGNHFYSKLDSNCQQFSDECLAILEIKNVFKGKIGRFLDSLSTTDSSDLTFSHIFDGEKEVHNFKNHKYLDDICSQKSRDGILKNNSDDFRLLKAYDRVFWLRYNRIRGSEKISEEERKELLQKFRCSDICFFGDPSTTVTCYNSSNEEEEDPLEYVKCK